MLKKVQKKILHAITHHRLAILAGFGFIGALYFSIITGQEKPAPHDQLSLPASSPFPICISGVGFVEMNTGNIRVKPHTNGIVSSIRVKEGQRVKKNDPLFQLDTEGVAADLELKAQGVKAAEASVALQDVIYAEAVDFSNRGKRLKSGYSISEEELIRREFAIKKAAAQKALLSAQVAQAKAEMAQAQVSLDQKIVRAPVDGRILKVGIRAGEYVSQTDTASHAVLMGNDRPLYIRVQIDENDIQRFKSNLKAYAFLKSDQNVKFPLKFIRMEPYAAPKRLLSGDSAELIDTRMVDCLYEILGTTDDQLLVGQQLDVYIEAAEMP